MDDKILKALKEWVNEHYDQHQTSWTYERSEGNYYDCFDDGYETGQTWAAYDIGCILGMKLEEPEDTDEED